MTHSQTDELQPIASIRLTVIELLSSNFEAMELVCLLFLAVIGHLHGSPLDVQVLRPQVQQTDAVARSVNLSSSRLRS
jgi:hypothetical protein